MTKGTGKVFFDCADTSMRPLWPVGHNKAVWSRNCTYPSVLGSLNLPRVCSAARMKAGMLVCLHAHLAAHSKAHCSSPEFTAEPTVEFVLPGGFESLRKSED